MKKTIASILSAMAAMAVVSGFILPNNQVSNSMIGGVHCQRQLQQQQQQFDHRISSENLLSTTTTRLLMSETSTRTFERREGGGPSSSYGGRGGRGRGGKLVLCTVSFFLQGLMYVAIFVLFSSFWIGIGASPSCVNGCRLQYLQILLHYYFHQSSNCWKESGGADSKNVVFCIHISFSHTY